MVPVNANGSLTDALLTHAANQPNVPAIVRRDGDDWTELTSAELLAEVRAVAKGLMASGVKPGDRVGLMSRTRFDWAITDFAIWYAGGVTVPIYETSSADQVQWILADSGAVAVLTETEAHMATVNSVRNSLPALSHSWIFDRNALAELKSAGEWISDADIDARRAAVQPNDIASIIYTSGTTGMPKGCTVTHGNFRFLAENVMAAVPEIFQDRNTSTLLFLPLAHVFGRIIEIVMIQSGLKVAFAPDIKDLVKDLAVFKPNFLLAVPRVFEKVFNASQQKAETEGKGKIFNAAADVAIAYSKAVADGKVPAGLKIKHGIFDKLVYKKLRAALGGNVKWSVSGGAALGDRLGHFFRGTGLTILEGYGLTETSSASTVNRPSMIKVGSVGRAIPGVTLGIGPDGEVLIKGPHVFTGYWNNDRATSEAIDSDGWFHTGDIGAIDSDGYLFITGRKKELIVTAGGKNVAPAVIEDRLRANWLVSQCMAVGDNKPFIGALITIDPDSLPQWLSRHNRPASSTISQLENDAEFIAEIQAAVDYANQAVSQAESIRKFKIVDAEWTEASGHLTPSMKLKRNIVSAEYGDLIEGIYS
jgi:long-chain acyl-CoA synthetase